MDHYSPYGARYIPHSLLTNDERGSTCVDRVNNVGFHDREFLFDIPDTVRRVAFFGDSFVEAAQVVADSIFFNVFEDLRNSRGWRCDAAGFGMSGNSADQEFFRSLHVMQQGRVDDIVHVFFANDFLDGYQRDLKPPAWPFLVDDAVGPVRFAGRYQYEDYLWSPARLTKLLVRNSYLVSFVTHRLSLLTPPPFPPNGFGVDERNLAIFARGDSLPPQHLLARQHWEHVMRTWKDVCRAHRVRFHVLYMPGKWEVDDSIYQAVFPPNVPQRGISTWMRGFCERNGIDFLDPSTFLADATGGKGRELYWSHLNGAGHKVLGLFLHQQLH